jgi:hypothetical protein
MDHEIICEEGICFIALFQPLLLNKIMMCGSIMNAVYLEMPPINVVLDTKDYSDDIVLLENISLEECKIKVDVVSYNSICLRVFEKNSRGSEDYIVGFKIRQDNLLKIARYCLDIAHNCKPNK